MQNKYRDVENAQELLEKFNSRDNCAFGEVYSLFFKELHYFTMSLYNSASIASEDIIQDAFLYIYQNKKIKFDKINGIKAYLYITIRNSVNRELLKLKRDEKYSDYISNDMLEVNIIEGEIYSIIPSILKLLPKDCVEIFRLVVEGYNVDEIADNLNITKRTVYNRKSEATKNIEK